MLSHFASRADRLLFACLTALLLALAALTVLSAATRIGAPWPGFVVWRNLVAPAIGGPDWPGARAGVPPRRAVVTMDGDAVRDAHELRARLGRAPRGAVHRYGFRRGAEFAEVAVASGTLRWRDVLPVYLPYWIDGFAFYALGLVVFYFRPRLPGARAVLALGTILGTVLLLASDVFSAFWADRLYFACESLTPAALLHLALCFPEEKALVRRRPWLRWAVYVPFVPLAAVQVALLERAPEAHLAANDLAYTAIAAAGLVSFASLLHTFLGSRSALARQQAKIVLAGVALGALLPSLGIFAIVLLGADVPMNVLAPFFLVYPLSMAYAIARHDLFSVDRYLRTGVVYAALSLLVFVSYAGVVLAGEWLLGAGRLPSYVVPLYVVVVLLLFDPLRAAIQRLVDRLFSRQVYNYRATVEATSRVLASVLDGDRIAATVLDTLTDVMTIDWAVLLVLGAEPRERRCFAKPPSRAREVERLLPATTALRRAVGALRRPLTGWELQEAGARRAADGVDLGPLHALQPALVLPVRFEAEAVGLLLVGEKRSGAFYTDEDVRLLETLVHQCALALTNARAYEIIRRTQADLVEAERLAAVGELASTVAHGIRNPLAGIRAAAQVAREDLEADAPVAESLDDIIAEADRLEARVRSILELARPAAAEPVRGDVNEVLASFAASIAARVPPGVRLVVEPGGGLPRAAFDPTHLAEALEVLVVNAFEATSGAGTVTLRSQLDDDTGRIAVSVTDTGPGIEPAALARVFDLFYTTKPSGTGVGLAMAKRLVERQGGSIAVSSTPGSGTTFTLFLPHAPGDVSGDAPVHAAR